MASNDPPPEGEGLKQSGSSSRMAAASTGAGRITAVEDSGGGSFDAKYHTKVTVLGSAAVGKTCLVRQLCFKKYQETYKVTLGADFGACLAHLDGTVCHVQIWDTAGHERFNSMGPAFYRGSQACILVYDVTSPKSFEDLREWKESFEEQADIAEDEDFPFIVVGNKCDLPKEDQLVPEAKAARWARENGCAAHFLCSAKEMTNVHAMLLDVVRLVLKRLKAREAAVDTADMFKDGGIKIDETVDKSDGCAC
uniref:Uncharacterized protein n=1 Tax=Cafeteria roenbergensis TaxID=33653 RepID=A0A7S0PGD4_CAFRO